MQHKRWRDWCLNAYLENLLALWIAMVKLLILYLNFSELSHCAAITPQQLIQQYLAQPHTQPVIIKNAIPVEMREKWSFEFFASDKFKNRVLPLNAYAPRKTQESTPIFFFVFNTSFLRWSSFLCFSCVFSCFLTVFLAAAPLPEIIERVRSFECSTVISHWEKQAPYLQVHTLFGFIHSQLFSWDWLCSRAGLADSRWNRARINSGFDGLLSVFVVPHPFSFSNHVLHKHTTPNRNGCQNTFRPHGSTSK